MARVAKPISIILPIELSDEGVTFYVQLRKEDGPLNNLWEFPGGKVEVSENPKSAALREFKEEIGLCLDEDDLTHFSIYPYEYEDRSLIFFIYTIDASKITSEKHGLTPQKITWESAKNDVESANIPEANKHFLMQFIEFKKSQLGIAKV
jgi:8-oxo-dGTP diphosphatase